MIIGDRLRLLREDKNLSQGDIEKRTGLMPCYISCVENGHTVPAVETLEKMAQAMDMHLYQFLYEGPEPRALPEPGKADRDGWGSSGKDARFIFSVSSRYSRWVMTSTRLLSLQSVANSPVRMVPAISADRLLIIFCKFSNAV